MGITSMLANAFGRAIAFLPNIFAALIILAVGLFVASILDRLTRRLLTAVGLDHRPTVRRLIGPEATLERLPSAGGRIVYWVLALVTVGVAVDALHLSWLSAGVARVLAYVPSVLAACAIGAAGYIGGNFLYREVARRPEAPTLSARLAARGDLRPRGVHGPAAARNRDLDRHHRVHGRAVRDGRGGRAGLRPREPRARGACHA